MRMPIVGSALAVTLIASPGCGSGEASREESQRTKREIDSAIGASGLPGATGINRAITASDSIAARTLLLDSLERER